MHDIIEFRFEDARLAIPAKAGRNDTVLLFALFSGTASITPQDGDGYRIETITLRDIDGRSGVIEFANPWWPLIHDSLVADKSRAIRDAIARWREQLPESPGDDKRKAVLA
jgi:hypothetical protein